MSARKPASAELSKATVSLKTDLCQFPIAGPGASAGGIEAMELLFESVPNDNVIPPGMNETTFIH
jgi:hypothetical protein